VDLIGQLNAGLVGRYVIEREIGTGGMATVFLARDLRHDRLVALKVLKPELGALLGAERFLSEIRVTANLQHPNLLPLFDSGESAGLLYYVMPYLDGATLRQRLDREKQLPVEDAVRLAVAICSALDYAHRHGVIHRDLKPENVLLHDGQPMVADFGIALAVSNAAGARLTQTGISVGTPEYMSPEQASGDKTIDARSDIYSVGALTYEMLAGEPPHGGPTAQAIIARLLTEDPRPLSSLRRSVPAHVNAAVLRALEKLPADRFTTATEFADALSGKAAAVVLPRRSDPRSLTKWRGATLVLAATTVAAVTWAATRSLDAGRATQQVRFSLVLPDSAPLNAATFYRSLDLSPDGTQLVYVGANGLFIRPLDDLTPRRLTTGQARDPRFSPNGAWVAYVSDDTLRKVSVGGGTPVTIVDSVGRFGWSPTGTIVFTRSGAAVADLWRVSENGSTPVRFVHRGRPNDAAYGTPVFLTDGDTFLVPSVTTRGGPPEIVAYGASDGKPHELGLRGGHPLYVADGVLLYVGPDGGVYADSFDTRALRVRGQPRRVLQGVLRKQSTAELAVSSMGTMVYLPAEVTGELVEIDRTGDKRKLPQPARLFVSPRYSPDGRRVAVGVDQGGSRDIWIYSLGSAAPKRLSRSGRAGSPEWSPDSRRVAWTQIEGALGGRAAEVSRTDIVWRAVDESDAETSLVPGGLGMAFGPSGDVGVGVFLGEGGRPILSVVQLDSSRRRTPIMPATSPPAARVSPDGNWIAYAAEESGQSEVYVRRLPSGARYPISVGGGAEPMWNPRGGELFYRAGQFLVATTLKLGAEDPVTRLDTLPFRFPNATAGIWANYDVSRDGQRFLMVDAAANDRPIVVTAWLNEVRDSLRTRR
jgi:hypothetical protein